MSTHESSRQPDFNWAQFVQVELHQLHIKDSLEASLKELRRAHAKQPDAEIAAHLGEVLWVKGERAEAQRLWEEARRKDPDNRTLLEAITRLATT